MENMQEIQSWFSEGRKYENDFAISVIISALSLNSIEVPIGHIDEYNSLLKELYEAYKEIVK